MDKANSPTCETMEPILADDGSGSDVTIPSFLMFKLDADNVKNYLMTYDDPVQMGMSWRVHPEDDDVRVEYDLWSMVGDPSTNGLIEKFLPMVHAFGSQAYFTPHAYIYDGIRAGCYHEDDNLCYGLCTNYGRYCATNPSTYNLIGVSGADVVVESLRRMCIWRYYGQADGIGEPWWKYVREFMQRCESSDYFANEDCVRDCFKHAGIDYDTISRCMADSGGISYDGGNSILDMELMSQVQRGIVVLPTITVDTVPMRGKISPSTVFNAICNAFPEDSDGTMPPKICNQCACCHDVMTCVTKGTCPCTPQQDCECHCPSSSMAQGALPSFVDTANPVESESVNVGVNESSYLAPHSPAKSQTLEAETISVDNTLVVLLLFLNLFLIVLVVLLSAWTFCLRKQPNEYKQVNQDEVATGRF